MSLLDLPLELRLIIYSYAAFTGPAVTIAAAQLAGSSSELLHRQYGHGRAPLLKLPPYHEAVICDNYSSHLLGAKSSDANVTKASAPEDYLKGTWHSPLGSLLLLNRQIHAELVGWFRGRNNRKTSAFVSYPHGIEVLRQKCPDLVRQMESLHICGVVPSRRKENQSRKTTNDSLAALIRAALVKNPVANFEARLYFDSDASGTIWDDESPLSIILRNIGTGNINIEVLKGRSGTGIYISVTPSTEEKRAVSTIWRRLEEQDGGKGDGADWVVDANWPVWTEYKATPASPAW